MSVVVTQADRDRAAEWMERFRPAGWRNAVVNIPKGSADASYSVQAFARHRTEATEELVRALTETARDMREAAHKLREFGAVLSADILCAQAAKSEAAIARATGAASDAREMGRGL